MKKKSEKTLLTIKILSCAPFKIENNEIYKYDSAPFEPKQGSNSRYFRECPLKFIWNFNRTCTFFKLFLNIHYLHFSNMLSLFTQAAYFLKYHVLFGELLCFYNMENTGPPTDYFVTYMYPPILIAYSYPMGTWRRERKGGRQRKREMREGNEGS